MSAGKSCMYGNHPMTMRRRQACAVFAVHAIMPFQRFPPKLPDVVFEPDADDFEPEVDGLDAEEPAADFPDVLPEVLEPLKLPDDLVADVPEEPVVLEGLAVADVPEDPVVLEGLLADGLVDVEELPEDAGLVDVTGAVTECPEAAGLELVTAVVPLFPEWFVVPVLMVVIFVLLSNVLPIYQLLPPLLVQLWPPR